ncbi:thiamine pyrophosphate-dependent enzyme [Streptomyces mirabilis]|uniref:thiamine pyrophosphate-dependent enzyme n=1 Tax=Streptomyces mirabilis TaxID=68239 RepID=UPI00379868A2
MRTVDFLDALFDTLPADAVVVAGLGRTGEEVYRRRPAQSLLTDTMGDVAALSLGIALAAPELTVVGLDTDGSFLMNLSVLPVLGSVMPALANYALAVLDNGIYESGGGLPSRTCVLDWLSLFAGVGIQARLVASSDLSLEGVVGAGTVLIATVTNDDPPTPVTKHLDGVESSYLMERAVSAARGRPLRKPARKS